MAGFARVAAADDYDPSTESVSAASASMMDNLASTEGAGSNDAPDAEEKPEEQISGSITHVLHRSKDNKFAILKVKVQTGKEFKIHTVVGPVRKGIVYSKGDDIEVVGKWGEHKKFGEQFQATSLKVLTQESRHLAGVRRFYQKYKDNLPGVGGKTFNHLVTHFGDDLPEKIADASALSAVIPMEKAEVIAKTWSRVMNSEAEQQVLAIMELGVNGNAASAIVDEWGKDAVSRFKASPWTAMTIEGVGFGSAEAAARTLELPADHKDRIHALVDLALQETEEMDGHIALPVLDLAKRAIKIAKLADNDGTKDLQVTIINQIPELISTKKLKARMTKDGPLMMRPVTYVAMVSLIRSLDFAQTHPVDTPLSILEERFTKAVDFVRDQGITLNRDQQKITWNALTQRVSLAIGFAGSGKTTSMAAVFKAFAGTNYVVSSLAGKAVVRARETAGATGYTMHSLLCWVPERWWVPRLRKHLSDQEYDIAKDSGEIPGVDFDDPKMAPTRRGPGFLHDQFRRLDYDFIALDESSMPSVVLFAQFLRAIDFRKTQVVLAGDTAQLLIGAGKTFADIIDAGILPTSILEEVYRQKNDTTGAAAGQEVSVLPEALRDIRDGKLPTTGEGYDLLERADAEILSTVVEEARRWNGEGRWNGSTLIMAPKRPGKVGLSALNKALKQEFNPPTGDVVPNDMESWRLYYITSDGQEIQITKGDPIIQVSNEPLPIITSGLAANGALPANIEVRKPSSRRDERTMNGTVGLFLGFRYIPEDPTGESDIEGWVATFKFEQEHEFIAAPVVMDKSRFGMYKIKGLEMGFAMSPYKAQGSEAKYAICVYPEEAFNQLNRNMIYTAASRGKKWTVSVGQKANFEKALEIVEAENRISPLAEFIRDNVSPTPEIEMPVIQYKMDETKDAALINSIAVEHGVSFSSESQASFDNLKALTSDLVDLSERSRMTVEEWIRTAESRRVEISSDVMRRARAMGIFANTEVPAIHEYLERLRTHDWMYEHSDEDRTFRKGSENMQRINHLKHEVGQDIAYLGWAMHAPHSKITTYPADSIPTWAYTEFDDAEQSLTECAEEISDNLLVNQDADGWDPTIDAPALEREPNAAIDECDIPF